MFLRMQPTKPCLRRQLYCPSLFRLWRTGAFAVRYEASEDDDDFDVNHKFLNFNNAYVLFILTGNRAEFTRRRIYTKQRSSCFFVDRFQSIF